MTLDNLVGVSLESIQVDVSIIQKLIQAAESSLNDARISEISNETRFDAA